MALLYIAEFDTLATPSEGGNAQIARLTPIAEQTIAISGTSTQSAAFNKATRFIRVETDSICAIAGGANPTAVTESTTNATATGGGIRLAANDKEYFGVTPGQKLAVISTT